MSQLTYLGWTEYDILTLEMKGPFHKSVLVELYVESVVDQVINNEK